MIELQNPEKYGLQFAYISGHYLEYKYNGSGKFGLNSSSDYYIKSERGGKLIFARLFGKGAKWITSHKTQTP